MDQPQEQPVRRTRLIKDLFYLVVCGILFAAGSYLWQRFHPSSPAETKGQVEESLNDH